MYECLIDVRSDCAGKTLADFFFFFRTVMMSTLLTLADAPPRGSKAVGRTN